MGEPFLAEIKMISWSYAPRGWAFCDGQMMPINQNQALFSLLGTTFGGNGQTTFALPDLRGCVMGHFGDGFTLGQKGGEMVHTLKVQEMPAHIHFAEGTSASGTTPVPAGTMVFANPGLNAYAGPVPPQPIVPTTVGNVGGGQPHENMSPYLVLAFVIALQGIFPSPN
jgi:microcystin-dependent protein